MSLWPHSKKLLGDDIQYSQNLAQAIGVRMSIDALIFADGEMVGPDTM
jgi:hypothetical protein